MDLLTAESEVRKAISRSSQERVAKAIGVSASILSRWLNGHSAPEGVSREKIFGWAENQALAMSPPPDLMEGVSWKLTLLTMRQHAEFVADLTQKATDAQQSIIMFLKSLEERYSSNSSNREAEGLEVARNAAHALRRASEAEGNMKGQKEGQKKHQKAV